MIYGSVCSGIEAASVAWHPLGWRAAFLSEIEPFPRAVLHHHFPAVPLHGDFTTIEAGRYEPIELLVGGTPCQSFSVAGLRGGLADDRGNLALEFLRLAQRLRPRWVVWENVPGVLSSNGGRDFGAVLGGLAELGYGWAYRVLDAQYFGLAQHRRRVFVVGCLGDWRRAVAVLFERHSLSGHPPPRREAGQGVATIPSRSTAGGGLGTDFDCDGGLIARLGVDTYNAALDGDIAHTIPAGAGPGRGAHALDIAHALRADGFDASEDGTGRGTPLVPTVAPCLTQNYGKQPDNSDTGAGPMLIPVQCNGNNVGTDLPSLRAGNQHITGGAPAIAFTCKDHGADAGDVAPTLRGMGHDGSHPNGGGQVAVAGTNRGIETEGAAERLRSASHGALPMVAHPVAFTVSEQANGFAWESPVHPTIQAHPQSDTSQRQVGIREGMAVRRLTPRECERLQGFPDDYTLVPYRGKPAADGPRYKALGNSMAVPCMAWIGQRIQVVEEMGAAECAA